jgi:hypothetical protein
MMLDNVTRLPHPENKVSELSEASIRIEDEVKTQGLQQREF